MLMEEWLDLVKVESTTAVGDSTGIALAVMGTAGQQLVAIAYHA